MFLVSSCSSLRSIYWSQVLSWEWRCSWSSADRRCSNYIWVLNNIIAYLGATYIRGFTVVWIYSYYVNNFETIMGTGRKFKCIFVKRKSKLCFQFPRMVFHRRYSFVRPYWLRNRLVPTRCKVVANTNGHIVHWQIDIQNHFDSDQPTKLSIYRIKTQTQTQTGVYST